MFDSKRAALDGNYEVSLGHRQFTCDCYHTQKGWKEGKGEKKITNLLYWHCSVTTVTQHSKNKCRDNFLTRNKAFDEASSIFCPHTIRNKEKLSPVLFSKIDFLRICKLCKRGKGTHRQLNFATAVTNSQRFFFLFFVRSGTKQNKKW